MPEAGLHGMSLLLLECFLIMCFFELVKHAHKKDAIYTVSLMHGLSAACVQKMEYLKSFRGFPGIDIGQRCTKCTKPIGRW